MRPLDALRWMNGVLYHRRFKGAGRLRSFSSRLLARRMKGPVVVRTYYGFPIIVDPLTDAGLERHLFLSGTYEAGTLHVIRSVLHRGDTFVDVGANIGLMTLLAAQTVGPGGRVVAFEANPSTFDILRQNIELNCLGQVVAIPSAVGAAGGTATIYSNLDVSRGSASLLPPDGGAQAIEDVSIATLDDALHQLRVDSTGVRMVKVDVEGWELEVMRGSTRLFSSPSPPALCIESSILNSSKVRMPSMLYDMISNGAGYEIFKLELGKMYPSPLVPVEREAEMPDHDNIYCFPSAMLPSIPRSLFA